MDFVCKVHQQFDQVHEESEAKQARLNRLREEIRTADQQHVNKGRASGISRLAWDDVRQWGRSRPCCCQG